eukprot:s3629_g1.t1
MKPEPELWCECVCAGERQEESQWTRQTFSALDGLGREDESIRSDPISADADRGSDEYLGGSYPASISVCFSSRRNTASGGLHSAFSPELDDPTRSQLRLSMTRRMRKEQSFEVDQDLLRGLSLRSTLQGLGWMKTGGIPKMLALFLSSGWRFALLAWLVAQLLSTMIYLACPDCIITPFTFKASVLDFEGYCPLAPWM